jgi:predicted phosphodiesterase
MMRTLDDISPASEASITLLARVVDIDRRVGKRRHAKLTLTDLENNRLTLIDYEGANLSAKWERDGIYVISNCPIRAGGQGPGPTLEPSKKTSVESLTVLLVIGDTHIGRASHPGTGEPIDPIGALETAIEEYLGENISAVIHTGDMFHEDVGASDITAFEKHVINPLERTGTPMYYVRGNHGTDRVDDLLTEHAGSVLHHLSMDGVAIGPNVRLFGIDKQSDGNLPRNSLRTADLQPGSVSLLVLHQTITQLSGPGDGHVDLKRLPNRVRTNLEYVIAGHHHDATKAQWRGLTIMYAGSTVELSKNHNADDRVCHLLLIREDGGTSVQLDIP